jgi:hypothetical protein
METLPNPGSAEALRRGCRCPVLDNNHGKWPPFPADEGRPAGWYLSVLCPVHARFQRVVPEPYWLEETDEGLSMKGRGEDE